MFEKNFKMKIKNFCQITISMLIFNRKTNDSLLFAWITPSNISNNLRTIVPGIIFHQIHYNSLQTNLCEEETLLNLNKHLR